jgi:flavin reductase (DIM6/NTAB) family NADH-FMN oxidoreductase RutF
MYQAIKNIFFRKTAIKTFFITRLAENQVEEKVWLKKGNFVVDITAKHSMICLDPFCMAVWLPANQMSLLDPERVEMKFSKKNRITASINLSIIENIQTDNGVLLLYKIERVKNNQLNKLHRLVLFAYLLRSKKNTYQSRRVISALYSYPRKIIIVSYQDEQYYNIFPMDIQGHIAEEGIYILGLRTTNVTLDKILEAKKVVICDTDQVDINTVYNLGKHSSTSPTRKEEMPFGTSDSLLFGFPVPSFCGGYKEVEIIHHKKMGYHMLLVGKVVHSKVIREDAASLYHVGFLEFQKSNYSSIEGVF